MKKEELIGFGIISAVGGAITALCLSSFTTWPALVIGGIVGSVFWGLEIACYVSEALYNIYKGYPILQGHFSEGIQHQHNRYCFIEVGIPTLMSAAVGVGLTAVLTSISPEIFAKWYTAIGAGAAIGAIGLAVGWLATDFIIMPMIEKIGKCFSSDGPDSSVGGTGVTGRSAGPQRT